MSSWCSWESELKIGKLMEQKEDIIEHYYIALIASFLLQTWIIIFILSYKQLIFSSTWTKTKIIWNFKSLPLINFSIIIIDNFPLFDSEKFELSTKCHTLYHLIRKFQLLIFQVTGSLSEGKQAYMALKLHLNIRV